MIYLATSSLPLALYSDFVFHLKGGDVQKAKSILGYVIGLIGLYLVSITVFANPPSLLSNVLWNDIFWLSAGILLVVIGLKFIFT